MVSHETTELVKVFLAMLSAQVLGDMKSRTSGERSGRQNRRDEEAEKKSVYRAKRVQRSLTKQPRAARDGRTSIEAGRAMLGCAS